MSGPIVRTGTNPKFWKNWDNVFGDKSATAKTDGKDASGKAKAAGSAPKKAAKKAAKKAGKKKA